MSTKALSFKDKEVQRAEALQSKSPPLLKNSEKIHTYVVFYADKIRHIIGAIVVALGGCIFLTISARALIPI